MGEVWQLIAKNECIEYYLYLLEQRGYKIESIGEKTHAIFEALLEDFSVSQIFKISWMSIRDTTDYLVRENLPSWKGKNMFIGAIQRKGDRAIAEKWAIKPSKRDFNCPQTVISSTFSDVFLGEAEKAFNAVPLPQGDI